jgi:hypothetical protein
MRLRKVKHGHRWPQKIKLGVIRLATGSTAKDIVRTILYRPRLFGGPFSDCIQESLRGPSDWSVGERELFAAFVSKCNQCVF